MQSLVLSQIPFLGSGVVVCDTAYFGIDPIPSKYGPVSPISIPIPIPILFSRGPTGAGGRYSPDRQPTRGGGGGGDRNTAQTGNRCRGVWEKKKKRICKAGPLYGRAPGPVPRKPIG